MMFLLLLLLISSDNAIKLHKVYHLHIFVVALLMHFRYSFKFGHKLHRAYHLDIYFNYVEVLHF